MGKKKTREAKMLREARLRMGYSQQEVANVIGVHMFDSSDHCGLQKKRENKYGLEITQKSDILYSDAYTSKILNTR